MKRFRTSRGCCSVVKIKQFVIYSAPCCVVYTVPGTLFILGHMIVLKSTSLRSLTPFVGRAGLTLRSRLQCDFIKHDKEDKSNTKKTRHLVC